MALKGTTVKWDPTGLNPVPYPQPHLVSTLYHAPNPTVPLRACKSSRTDHVPEENPRYVGCTGLRAETNRPVAAQEPGLRGSEKPGGQAEQRAEQTALYRSHSAHPR